ncbi:MAG: hypothetical protein MJZ06_01855, partial [Bacteroidaceae bacterium]|nr:hypothetical protein [Bacteroidaceae bacterium]
MKTNRSSFARRLSNSIIARVTLLLVTALFLTAVFSHIIIGGVSERSVENALQSTVLEIEKNLGRAEVAATNVAWVAHETVDNPEHLFYITRQTVLNNPSVIGSAVALRPD